MLVGAAGGGTFLLSAGVDLKQLHFDAISATGPVVRALLDAESSHNLGIFAAKYGFMPRETRPDPVSLRTTVWGREFSNPIGKFTYFFNPRSILCQF